MENEDGHEDDGPVFPWLPPEDRLWRHPSEMSGEDRGSTVALAGPSHPGGRVWTIAVAAALVGALVASGLFVATGNLDHRTTVIEQVTTPRPVLATSDHSARSAGWPAVADSLAPAVAQVTVAGPDGTVQGSAVLYARSHDTTYLLSASDLLIGGGAVTVTFDASHPVTAKVTGMDSTTGIALLSVTGSRPDVVPTYGSANGVAVAEAVLAIGSLTTSGASVAAGSISGLDQPVDAGGTSLYGMLAVSGLSVGSSSDGGAIVDQYGQVIGIETDMTSLADQDGLAYAVPINVVEHVAGQLLAGITPTHPWLGVENTTDLSSASAIALGVGGGAQIGAVASGSPAAAAGIDANDVITSFGGQPVTSAGELTALLASATPGRKTQVAYLDDGRRHHVVLTPVEQPTDSGS